MMRDITSLVEYLKRCLEDMEESETDADLLEEAAEFKKEVDALVGALITDLEDQENSENKL